MASRVLITSDGKRGHENQSRVIARMLGDRQPLVMHLRDNVREGGIVEFALRLRLAMGGRERMSQRGAVALVKRLLKPESPDGLRDLAGEVRAAGGGLRMFTVSSGTPPATLNLVLARMLGAQSIVNMTPSMIPRRRFDLNIVPAHDVKGEASPGGNVVVSPLALGYHDSAAAQLLASELVRENGLEREAKYWGVAIGGPSRGCPWAGDRVLDELATLHGLARGMDARLLVTTSRRTPEHCVNWLKKHYLSSEQVAYFLNAADDPLNPLPAMYELCEHMFVTGDSFSMVSEAVQAGHCPVVLRVRIGNAPGKVGRALERLSDAGLVCFGGPDDEVPQRMPPPEYARGEPNAPYKELREAVRNALGLVGDD